MNTIKPIWLLADSQLLFWRDDDGQLFLERALAAFDEDERDDPELSAAYLGASNGDLPEFYELFVGAMSGIGIDRCRMIPSAPGPEDFAFLDKADVILLAGGDIERGWDVFQETGLQAKIVERHYAGALLIGISAGAVQLGLKGWNEASQTLFDTFRLVPFVVDVHEEPNWGRLQELVPRVGEQARGYGIPSGGGALYHPDATFQPVRHPVVEVRATEEGLRQSLVFPGDTVEETGEETAPSGPSPVLQELMNDQGYIEVAPDRYQVGEPEPEELEEEPAEEPEEETVN